MFGIRLVHIRTIQFGTGLRSQHGLSKLQLDSILRRRMGTATPVSLLSQT